MGKDIAINTYIYLRYLPPALLAARPACLAPALPIVRLYLLTAHPITARSPAYPAPAPSIYTRHLYPAPAPGTCTRHLHPGALGTARDSWDSRYPCTGAARRFWDACNWIMLCDWAMRIIELSCCTIEPCCAIEPYYAIKLCVQLSYTYNWAIILYDRTILYALVLACGKYSN